MEGRRGGVIGGRPSGTVAGPLPWADGPSWFVFVIVLVRWCTSTGSNQSEEVAAAKHSRCSPATTSSLDRRPPRAARPDVTVSDLLLKIHVADLIDRSAYTLVTESAMAHVDIPLERTLPITEQ
jgi:hypothetical protein